MATKKAMKTPIKKYAAGGTKDCVKKACSDMEYWRQDLCRCVKLLTMDNLKHPPSENDRFFGAFGEYKDAKKMKETTGDLIENANKLKKKSKMGGATKKTYKTGGMVNANANLKATKSPGSKGVKPSVNPKAAASKTAKKPSKPRSKAPKKATPGRK